MKRTLKIARISQLSFPLRRAPSRFRGQDRAHATVHGVPSEGAAEGRLLDRVELRPPRPPRRHLPLPEPLLLAPSRRREWRGDCAALLGSAGEAGHQAGEVQRGGLRLEDGVGDEKVEPAGLEPVVRPEWVGAEGKEVGGGKQDVGRRLPGDLGDGDRRLVVLEVAVHVNHPHAIERPLPPATSHTPTHFSLSLS